jgi:PiT family inorganic phosphate transporter
MGLRITSLRASSGLAANVGAVTAIFGATGLGIPISTTHAAASSVTGSGVASGEGVNLKVVGEMVVAWVITIPATVTIGWIMFELTQLPGPAAYVSVGAVLFILLGWIAWAMSRALRAADVAAEIASAAELREPVSAVPHVEGHGTIE